MILIELDGCWEEMKMLVLAEICRLDRAPHVITDFQSFGSRGPFYPMALPWAGMGWTFGPENLQVPTIPAWPGVS